MSETTVHLPVDLYSSDQLSAVILELQAHIDMLRDEAVRAKAGKATADPPAISALLVGVLHGANVRLESRPGAEQVLKVLTTIRKQAPQVHLSLAALPARTLKRQLTVWFRTQIHPYALLTFTARSDLCGGIVVQAGSHIYDFSFREPLINNRARLAELVQYV